MIFEENFDLYNHDLTTTSLKLIYSFISITTRGTTFTRESPVALYIFTADLPHTSFADSCGVSPTLN
jgi:hypothetical protein